MVKRNRNMFREVFLGLVSFGIPYGTACKNLNRDFIGIELNEKYFEIAKKRIEDSSKP